MHTTTQTATPVVKVTVIPYDAEYERQVRRSLDSGTNREGQTFSTYTNVDGGYSK